MDLQKTMEAIENFDDMWFHETISELVSYSFRLACIGSEIQLGINLGAWTYTVAVERYSQPFPSEVSDRELIRYFMFDISAHREDRLGRYDKEKVEEFEELLGLMKYAESEPERFIEMIKCKFKR